MNIKQFSQATGLTARAIRFYEEKGILKNKRDSQNGYRVFDKADIAMAKRISEFRNLGFSVNDVAQMLKTSPLLQIKDIKRNIKSNLGKLYQDLSRTEKRIKETESLLKLSPKNPITHRQKELMRNMTLMDLQDWSVDYVKSRLKKKDLGPDEQLQMIACAYGDLLFKHQMGVQLKDYANAHKLIAETLLKAKEASLATRHKKLAEAYENLHKDPSYYDLSTK